MNTEIDLLKLCGVVGIEAIQKMFDSHIKQSSLKRFNMYKLIKKGFYSDHSTLTNIVWCITSGIVIATLSFIIATS